MIASESADLEQVHRIHYCMFLSR